MPLGIAIVATSLVTGPASLAVPPEPAKPTQPAAVHDAADDWFDKGIAAYEAHKLTEARAAFLEAWKLKKTQDTAANLGTVELEQHEPRKAAEHLAYAVHHGAPTDSDAARRAARDRFDQARKLVGAVRVRVNVPGASVYVNGEPAGLAPLEGEVFVDPGRSIIEAKLVGYQDARAVVQVEKGAATDANLVLVSAEERRNVVPAIIMGGIGGVAAVTGAVLVGLGVSKRSDARSLGVQTNHSCVVNDPAPQGPCAQLASVATQADRFGNGGIVAFVVAGAAAVGATTYMLWPTSRRGSASGRSVLAVPLVSTNGGGLVVSGSF
jgi:hypothetical protein